MNAGLYHPQIIFYMVSLAAQQASHGAKILHLIQTQPWPPPILDPQMVWWHNWALSYCIQNIVVAPATLQIDHGKEWLLEFYAYTQQQEAHEILI